MYKEEYASPLFRPLPLGPASLAAGAPGCFTHSFAQYLEGFPRGDAIFLGIPFHLDGFAVPTADGTIVELDIPATEPYVVFLHVCDFGPAEPREFWAPESPGEPELGANVSVYTLESALGQTVERSIQTRLEIGECVTGTGHCLAAGRNILSGCSPGNTRGWPPPYACLYCVENPFAGNGLSRMVTSPGGINPAAVRELYRFWSCGMNVAVVGGTDKMDAATPLGAMRTYARVLEITPGAFHQAVRGRATFASCGALVDFSLGSLRVGDTADFAGAPVYEARWELAPCGIPVTRVECVMNGRVVFSRAFAPAVADEVSGTFSLAPAESCFVAMRVFGLSAEGDEIIAAHTSAIQLRQNGESPYNAAAAGVIARANLQLKRNDRLKK